MNRIFFQFQSLWQTDDNYRLTSWLFLKLLALIYLAAFLSLSTQIVGLVGSHGILPVENIQPAIAHDYGNWAWLRVPSLFWLDDSDLSLQLACYAGCLFAVILLLGRIQLLSLITMFVLYLSLLHAGQLFLNFQWDYLLLEAGFVAIFISRGSNRLTIFLFHWLLFRLRLLSGLSKITSGDVSWSELNALKYYFETQPLPHAGSWYAHQLPEWLLTTGTGFTLFVELIVPFFIFLPRPFRLFAAASTILIQLLIIMTSNHNWINLLTIALCLFLLDDRIVSRILPTGLLKHVPSQAIARGLRPLQLVAGAAILFTSLATASSLLFDTKIPEAARWVRNYGLGNPYHVFPTMQTERHELQIEGSYDGRNWQPYLFKYKPNEITEIPQFIVPHQPRLDWMIWFVPPRHPDMRYWFESFMFRLQQNEPTVTALLRHNPFDNKPPPKYLRVMVYRYRFTTEEEKAASGNYWKKQLLGEFPFVPPRRP